MLYIHNSLSRLRHKLNRGDRGRMVDFRGVRADCLDSTRPSSLSENVTGCPCTKTRGSSSTPKLPLRERGRGTEEPVLLATLGALELSQRFPSGECRCHWTAVGRRGRTRGEIPTPAPRGCVRMETCAGKRTVSLVRRRVETDAAVGRHAAHRVLMGHETLAQPSRGLGRHGHAPVPISRTAASHRSFAHESCLLHRPAATSRRSFAHESRLLHRRSAATVRQIVGSLLLDRPAD